MEGRIFSLEEKCKFECNFLVIGMCNTLYSVNNSAHRFRLPHPPFYSDGAGTV